MKKLILISALLISFYAMAYDVMSETSAIDQNGILEQAIVALGGREFLDNKIKHLTKIWNPHYLFKQIGWE